METMAQGSLSDTHRDDSLRRISVTNVSCVWMVSETTFLMMQYDNAYEVGFPVFQMGVYLDVVTGEARGNMVYLVDNHRYVTEEHNMLLREVTREQYDEYFRDPTPLLAELIL